MKKQRMRAVLLCALFLVCAFVCMFFANRIQHGGGTVEIKEGFIEADQDGKEIGQIRYKLYKPAGVSETNKAPGVLLLHGYQNDHETCAAYAIELARRGYVVLAIDEYGHGLTTAGLKYRGYVNHKVTVNYGEDSEEAGTFKKAGGPVRYRIMMNFSNLDFFLPRYSADSDGNTLLDTSCGGVIAYSVLADMPFVDSTRLGLSGHSMGTWSSWTVAAALSGTEIEPKATVLQCGELFTDDAYDAERYHFNNVLLLQAKWDEFSYFRDYEKNVTDELLKSDLRTEFLGSDASSAKWNTTFGNFGDGSARRIELLYTNHRLTTHNSKGLAAAIDWFDEALGHSSPIPSDAQTAMGKEWLVFFAMLLVIAAMIPWMNLLLTIPFFAKVIQPLPNKYRAKTSGQWWKGAVITMLIAASTYPFMTQLGHGLLPLPENIFRMTVGNGFIAWYLLLIVIMLVLTAVSRKRGKKKGTVQTYSDCGLAAAENPDKISISLCLRSAVLVLCTVLLMYLCVVIFEAAFKLDLRFIWPFFKGFNGERLLQFLVYIPVFALFFILNNSKIMASARTRWTYEPGMKGFIQTWWRNAVMMAGGIFIIILLEYIPFFLGIGPGADLLFGSTFGGPFMSLLIVFFPQVLVFSVLGTIIYRKTGSVYPGAILIAVLAAWVVTGGSSML